MHFTALLPETGRIKERWVKMLKIRDDMVLLLPEDVRGGLP